MSHNFILWVLVISQRIHSQLESAAEVYPTYYICLQMGMCPGAAYLLPYKYICLLLWFHCAEGKPSRNGPRCHFACCGSILINFCLPSSPVVMMLGSLTLFVYLTSKLIRIALSPGVLFPNLSERKAAEVFIPSFLFQHVSWRPSVCQALW